MEHDSSANVWYSRNDHIGMRQFRYHWIRYNGNGNHDGEKTVYCYNRQDFLKLIDRWNSRPDSGWVYTAL
jgi:hypothetical protein